MEETKQVAKLLAEPPKASSPAAKMTAPVQPAAIIEPPKPEPIDAPHVGRIREAAHEPKCQERLKQILDRIREAGVEGLDRIEETMPCALAPKVMSLLKERGFTVNEMGGHGDWHNKTLGIQW